MAQRRYNRKYKCTKQHSAPKRVAWEASRRYANHMGRKYDLSKSEIEKNHREHYREALKDSDFFIDLVHEYYSK